MNRRHSIYVNHQDARRPLRWSEKIQVRFALLQLALLLIIVGATIVILFSVERHLLMEQGFDLAEQLGNKIVAELEQQTSAAELLSGSLATLGEVLEPDADIYHRMVPNLLDNEHQKSLIAGGGIWPEPGSFQPGVDRHAFFWGRDDGGILRFLDNYNDPEGPGYHGEEWYGPATFYPSGMGYWSKSYMDPYSFEPMVTCSVPMYRGSDLIGVATVDIKLEWLNRFFEQAAARVKGYIFSLDRNNRVLSFPKPEMAKRYKPDGKGKLTEQFINLEELTAQEPGFQTVANTLTSMDEAFLANAEAAGGFGDELVERIEASSNQIAPMEARVIASGLYRQKNPRPDLSLSVRRLFWDDDPLLKEKVMASVFRVPTTHWKVVVVTPTSHFHDLADLVTRKVAFYVVSLEVLALFVLFLFLRHMVIKPIWEMAERIRADADEAGGGEMLDTSLVGELGDLAHEFNLRTGRLSSALEGLDKVNRELEQRVAERAQAEADLQKAHDLLEQRVAERTADLSDINEEMKSFTSIVSHDLRAPLTNIGGFSAEIKHCLGELSELLDQPDEERDKEWHEDFNLILSDDIPEALNYIDVSVRRMDGQIRAILKLARAGHRELHLEPIDMNQLIGDLCRSIEHQVNQSSTEVVVGALPQVTSDRTALEQIMGNLLDNAVKYLDPSRSGEINISGECTQTHVVFRVRDNGRGIRKSEKDRIFQIFRRAGKQDVEGEGLGLAYVQALLRSMGGSIACESELNAGSTFIVSLPLDYDS